MPLLAKTVKYVSSFNRIEFGLNIIENQMEGLNLNLSTSVVFDEIGGFRWKLRFFTKLTISSKTETKDLSLRKVIPYILHYG